MVKSEVIPPRPDWLDDEFLRKCIEADETVADKDKDIPIENVQLEYAVPKGENFASIILRVIINAKRKPNNEIHLINGNNIYLTNGRAENGVNSEEKRYILKVGHSGGVIKKQVDELKAFPKEKDMYDRLVPELHCLLRTAGITTKFACRGLHSEPFMDVIALEDLGLLGYVLGNRHEGLDLDHCKLAVSKLACMHASSMRYYEKKTLSALKPFYKVSLMGRDLQNEMLSRDDLTEKFTNLSEDLRTRPGYENEANYVDSIREQAFDRICKAYEIQPGNLFNAQLHGDCWVNNMMFKMDKNGKPQDLILIDLQISYYNSILNDFIYFVTTSASVDVINNHFDELVHFYLEYLVDVLMAVGYEGVIPTYGQFKDELKKKVDITYFLLCVMVPVMKNQMKEEAKCRTETDSVSVDEIIGLLQNTRKTVNYLRHIFAIVDLMRREQMITNN